jgi:hypothetical protein
MGVAMINVMIHFYTFLEILEVKNNIFMKTMFSVESTGTGSNRSVGAPEIVTHC